LDFQNKLLLALVLIAGAFLSLARAEEKRIAIFSPQTSFTLPVTERDGRDYVGLVDVLEPLGSVRATTDGNKWKLRFEQREAEFVDRQTLVKLNTKNKKFDLPASFRLESNRGLVPVAALGSLISQLTGISPIVFHEDSRRLFVGKVAVRFTEELQKENPPRLVLNFTSPASPTIASEPGKVRLTFTREPIMPPPVSPVKFDDAVITSAQYEEANGIAVLTVFTTAPLLASFSNEGRTLTLTRAPQAQVAPQANNASSPSPQAQTLGPTTNGTPATPPLASGTVEVPETTGTGLRHFFAVIDAAHGGTERGAGLSDALPEKDVVLSFARYLQKELQTRGISALILRDSDATLSLDQRASLANSAHPMLYITMHAASQGKGVRIYTSLLPFSGNANGPFQPWEAAQAPHVRTAVATADSVASELRKHDIRARVLSAPLRPMNNLIAAAIAIEVAPPDAELPGLVSPNYQQSVASAIADGILAARPQLEAGR
jgi:N-acetylmuramoyl-L-alanine amidase